MGRHGHTAVKVDSKVADGVSWVDFSMAKGEGTAVKEMLTPEGGAPYKFRFRWIEFETVGCHPL